MQRRNREAARRLMGRLALRESAGNGERPWYKFQAKGGGENEVDLYLYDEISMWGVSAEAFMQDLQGVSARTINLRLNSPGGDVFDGAAIFNALEQHPARIVTHIDGLAASMASIIALAGDEIRMAENAFFMIHNPWALVMGNADDLRHEADVLDKIGASMVSTYVRKSGQSETQIREWLDEETWFSADEAKEAGFATEIVAGPKVESRFDLSMYGKVPDTLQGKSPTEWSEREFEGFLRDAGFSRKEAAAIVGGGYRSLRQGDPGAEDLAAILRRNIEAIKGGTNLWISSS